MNDIQKLFESELLSDEVKSELKTAFDTHVTELQESVRNEVEVEFAQKFVLEKAELQEKLYELINEAVEGEIKELKEDIDKYRKLEVTYAQKLEEFKSEYADKLSDNFEALVETQVQAEFGELKQDLMEAKKQNFGQRLFEAFQEEFESFGIGDDVIDLRSKIEGLEDALAESKRESSELKRDKVMESLLSNLKGSKKEVMKTILENVDTDKLEDRYNETVDSVLVEKKDEDGTTVSDDNADGEVVLTESDSNKKNSAEIERLRKLSGLN